ncbi:PREDICTED: fatty acid 2-hydroxylase [Bactrocera latifrons]|uniref:Fatty acid 2-hydroxylase n=1 Tax=Bactrocera latifrons TaxID=174628 RepID=A0A0K8ULM3_BACLA|nr:PREDICTED: fatty acid 2-hydroxylase [Bactrocera latifrons]XP_018803110.1 PREDICTED: fatty acid 2-hydroxylase [Bactrocera latifrons]XP_018803111.1 PREDICTED: fatty acid 2-hydroxylase [Bactrocera latifrons]XP_018803112.1 PREDICTED: fatty acid 2-hydroxylase [Bactrocera latifrons]XP_018803113.1 PREDICTED: fatty acid 2-hydroxylase [Bactrocera latifrons]
MPTTVSDLILPSATSAAITTTAMPMTTTTKPMPNGKVMQSQNEQQQSTELNVKSVRNGLKRSEEQQCIIKYRQKYYDIRRFLHNHPGGINTLRDLNNSDMTTRFLHAPPHSDAAMYLMKEYEIKPTQSQNHTKRRHRLHQSVDDEQITVDNEQEQHVFAESNENGIELLGDILHEEDKNNNQLDESMEHLVDWSKAMLPQISHITRHYDEWVHKPVDRPLRLFGPTYLEMLTKTPWWVIPLFWIPVISKCLWEGFSPIWNTSSLNELLFMTAYFAAGILLWTFLEYVLHRFVFHMKVNANTHPLLCSFHFMIHGLHHKVPFDSMRLVFPPMPGVVIASLLYAPLSVLLPQPRIVLAGALSGYLCYDLMHYYLHYGNPSLQNTRFMYNMKRYHYQHHFAHQDMGYGISSPLWDVVFNTRIHLRKLRYTLRWR